MSKRVEVQLNSPGIRELLRSGEMEAMLSERAAEIAARCGSGYGHDTYVTGGRVVASVYTEDAAAAQDNLEHNTILRSLK